MLIINAPSCDALRTCCLISKACGGLLIFHCILIRSLCLSVVWWFCLIAREFQLDLWAFSPWRGHRRQIRARPRWLRRSGHKWITLHRAWHGLTGLIERLISLCAACPQGCLLLTSQPLGSPWPFRGKHCCFYKLMLHLKSFLPRRALRLERFGINIPDSAGFIFQSRF